jgi:hypothetical protein
MFGGHPTRIIRVRISQVKVREQVDEGSQSEVRGVRGVGREEWGERRGARFERRFRAAGPEVRDLRSKP